MVTNIEDLRVYQIAEEIADKIWDICDKWNAFAKRTVGEQLVRAGDSIGANIAEGFGRYHYKENIKFLYYARGSLHEITFWLKRALKRKLITDKEYKEMDALCKNLHPQLNAYINSIGKPGIRQEG
ncbi:MAG: four helix bundle protein [Planctomycetes bacterium]|nr:four helix bundle protein [Planctomycetota bacterium]